MPIIPIILQYWRQILYGIGAIAVICSVLYVRHVFAQNEDRRIELIEKTAQIENLKAGFEAYLKLNQDIQASLEKERDDLKKRIKGIENWTPPATGTKFVFMPYSSGMRP